MPQSAGLCVLSFLVFTSSTMAAQETTSGHAQLVDEAWQAVDSTYYDPSFHGLDWSAVRDEFLARDYTSREEAYTAIREMLAQLGNSATRFLTPEQAAAEIVEFSGQPHVGVGLLELLSVDTNEKTGEIVIVTPVPGGPAARAGLRPGDVVASVDGDSAKALGLANTMSSLRGRAGTSVDLRIRRGAETFEIRMRRDSIPALDPLQGFVRDEDGAKIGYIGLKQFTPDAPQRVGKLLAEFDAKGVAACVLDLRNNPGGFVPSVQQIAGMFLGEVPIARLKDRSPEPTALRAEGEKREARPLAVLVNEGSASAAEVLAGALQDHHRGIVLGAPTFGKGLAHGFQPLSDGSAVMPTLGRLETLGGRDLLDEGIMPDSLVAAPVSPVIDETVEVASAEDQQYRRAIEVLLRRSTQGG